MKRITDILISIFISVEFLVGFLFFLAYQTCPNYFDLLGTRLTQNSDFIKYLTFIPVGLLAIIMKDKKDLLFPDHVSNEILQEWPDFHMIEDRYYLTLFFILVCFLSCGGIWALNFKLSSGLYFAIFIAAVTISVITFVHYHYATIKIRRILSKYKKGT